MLRALFHVDAVDRFAVGAALVGDQGLAEHLLGVGAHLVDGLDYSDAALVTGFGFLEAPFAAPTGVYLGFDHPDRAAKRLGSGHGFLR